MSCIVCLSIYTLFVLIISFIIYYKNQIFYRPLYYINPDTSEKIDVHKKYPEFVVLDHNSFFRIFIAFYIFAIPRFIINVILAVGQILEIKSNMADLKNPTTDPEEWNIMSNTISRWTRWLLWWNSINVNIIKDDKKYLEVYKKYLGDDYEVDSNEKYSLIVSNHLGFYDIVMNMAINKCGFLAKEETKKYCLVSTIAKGINCLFVNRNDKENRKKILTELEKRQKDFYDGNLLTPICIFPEGTTTNGKYILKFKRGAFRISYHDICSGYITGHKIGGKLYPLKRKIQNMTYGIYKPCLSKSRHTFKEYISSCQKCNYNTVNYISLTYYLL